VVDYHIACLRASLGFDSPSIYQRQIDSCSSAQSATVRPEIAYIVPRESVLHTGACSFRARLEQIVTGSLPYSGVSEPGRRQGARVGLLVRLGLTS